MTPNVTPEERARDLIDQQLTQAGWFVCDRKDIDLFNHEGVAVREVIMATGHGRADYLLFVDRKSSVSSRLSRWEQRSQVCSGSRRCMRRIA